jgi:hypothetical protein
MTLRTGFGPSSIALDAGFTDHLGPAFDITLDQRLGVRH